MNTQFSELDIDDFIERVEASGVMGRSKRRLRLLNHLLRSELEGNGVSLKAYSIGLDIFGKPAEFDPSADSVVRVEMGRLRTALSLFEASKFANTRIVVGIPVGTYRPQVILRDSGVIPGPAFEPVDESVQPPPIGQPSTPRMIRLLGLAGIVALCLGGGAYFWQSSAQPRPAIGVQVNSVAGPSDSSQLVNTALSLALSRSQTIKVFESLAQDEIHKDASFLIASEVIPTGDGKTIITRLTETATDQLIWAHSLKLDKTEDLTQNVEAHIARELRIRLFGASKNILEKARPEDLSPEALFVLSTWVPGVAQSAIEWELERIRYAQMALEKDPDYGAAHSVLADKLAYLANVYAPSNTPDNLKDAMLHAQRAMDLSPLDADVVFNVAQFYWHSGLIAQSHATMTRVVELDPSHELARFLSTVIPYSCAVPPDDVIASAIAFDAALSPDNPIRWLTLTWIGWLHGHRQEWTKSLVAEEAASRIFQIPYSFMRHAMVLNQLDRPEDAANVINAQTTNWSGFEPSHFVTTTIPRLCSETPDSDVFRGYYAQMIKQIDDLTEF